MRPLLLYNANIVTVDEALPRATALLAENGRISRVGESADLLASCPPGTQKRDMKGRTILPGFVDGHSHITMACLFRRFPSPPVGDIDTVEKLVEAARAEFDRKPPAMGKWFVGQGYDNAAFPGGGHPTCRDLDRISMTVPVLMMHVSGHVGVVNSAALQSLGITRQTPSPAGGVIGRWSDGAPNGLLEEKALTDTLSRLGAKVLPPLGELLDLPVKAQKMYASYGITTAQDGAAAASVSLLYRQAGLRGKMMLDVTSYMLLDGNNRKALKDVDSRVVRYRDHYRVAGAKLLLDGSPQAKTAWLSQPYYVVPEGKPQDYSGFPIYENGNTVGGLFAECLRSNWQVLVHCNGDAACQQMIDQYRRALELTGVKADLRPVMIHAQTVRDDQLDQMKELGITPSFYHDHTYYWGDYHMASVLGPQRGSRISPLRTALDKGIRFTIHQDTPVVPPNMLFSIHCAVNRVTCTGQPIGQEQCIPPLEAIKAVTINSAWQCHEDDRKGSISPRKLADLVVLDADPTAVPKEAIKDIRVLETIKEGRTVYRA